MTEGLDQESTRQMLELIEEALILPAEQRAGWLQARCPTALLERALRMLAIVDDMTEANVSGSLASAAQAAVPLEKRRVGAYRLKELIGEGGMGQVYLAERDDGEFTQTAAIKLIRGGHLNALAVHQFETERQILSDLVHPNIARLLDGGTTEDGLPYVVMEYVDGAPLNQYLAANQLDVRSCLNLFLPICAAVEHAHRSLVIHRDIKPGNILISREGVPKLLDFGIAKVVAPQLQDRTMTVASALTPAYASPEQLAGAPLTTATDIYSLGVVLYQSLTGEKPLDGEGLSPAGFERLVTGTDPDAPSQRLRKLDAPGAETLRGDIDAIVLRAIAREPERRYPSVAEFADDIRRYLEGRPVQARGDSVGYRLGRFVRRHRWLVAAGTAVSIALLVSYTITVQQYQVAREEQRRADARFLQARTLAKAVFFDVYDKIQHVQGTLPAREALAETGVVYLDELAKDKNMPDDVLLDLGVQYTRLSDLYGGLGIANLGDTQRSYDLLLKGEQALEALLARHPDDPEVISELIWVKRLLANQSLVYRLDTEEALEHVLTGMSLAERTLPGGRDWAIESRKWNIRTDYLKVLGAKNESEQALLTVDDYLREIDHPEIRQNLLNHQGKVVYLRGLRADLLAHFDRVEEAIADYEAARSFYAQGHREDPSNTYLMIQNMRFNAELAAMYSRLERWSHAIDNSRTGLEFAERLLSLDPRDAGSRRNLATQQQTLAKALAGAGRGAEARQTIQSAVTTYRELSESDIGNPSARVDFAQSLYDAGMLYLEDQPEAGCSHLRHAETVWRDLEMAPGTEPQGSSSSRGALEQALREHCAT